MSDGENRRSLTGWLARLGASLRGTLDYAELGDAADGAVHLSRALPRFFSVMRGREAPVLVDLGPVVGENVALLGDLLGCKLHIENVFGDIDRLMKDRRDSEICAELPTRFSHPDSSIDGILCWDVIDYLSQPAAAALLSELARMLKPGGMGMAVFSTIRSNEQRYRKYVMVDEHHLRHRSYPAAQGPHRLWSSRDVQLLLANLEVDESFLLTHRQRETLFHKPMHAGSSR
ncbi:MAG: methyltransferase domain-containing protein [Acidobacteria bacterium]|nr:methyltransferase domain-containing protein [Acidobacteriota bacterium]